MADIGSFTIEGYIATYKKGEKQITINVLDKKVFDSAIHNFVLAFIAEEEYSNYMNNTQKEIETTGKVIKNMYSNLEKPSFEEGIEKIYIVDANGKLHLKVRVE